MITVREPSPRAEPGLLTIRRMRAADIDAVVEIERAVFPMPWSRRCFENELADGSRSLSWVAERDGAVVGYLVSWLVEDELHIGNVAVAPAAQCAGVGRSLLKNALEDAEERGVSCATLEVRMSNARAIGLYSKLGFIPVAMRKRYYSDNGEDALVMIRYFGQEEGA